MRRTIGPASDSIASRYALASVEVLRTSTEETGHARSARVSIGGRQGASASIVVVVGAAKPRLGRDVLRR
jgi:hypothetical protein